MNVFASCDDDFLILTLRLFGYAVLKATVRRFASVRPTSQRDFADLSALHCFHQLLRTHKRLRQFSDIVCCRNFACVDTNKPSSLCKKKRFVSLFLTDARHCCVVRNLRLLVFPFPKVNVKTYGYDLLILTIHLYGE